MIPYTVQRAIQNDKVFDPAQEMAIREVRYIEANKVHLQYQRRRKDISNVQQRTDPKVGSDLPIRRTTFPKKDENYQFANRNPREAVMPACASLYLRAGFHDPRIVLLRAPYSAGGQHPQHDLSEAESLPLLEVGASPVFQADELAGGSAFCYFRAGQKSAYLASSIIIATDWGRSVFFAGQALLCTYGRT
jgi:monoamine oxidase